MRIRALVLIMMLSIFCLQTMGTCDPGASKSQGQLVYVPVYSHVYGGPRSNPLDLTATLSIRNTDPEVSLSVTSVKYFNSDGKLIKVYVDKNRILGPLATADFIVEEFDTSGGSGAKFLVEWKSDQAVSSPILECVMISTRSGLGLSFLTQGRVIKDRSY